MSVNTTISVKGTRYYNAPDLYKNGTLHRGLSALLICQPDNPYDSNAVAVKLATGEMLGHVSKELAPKYTKLIRSEKLIETTIFKVEESRQFINVYVRVIYDRDDDKLKKNINHGYGKLQLIYQKIQAYMRFVIQKQGNHILDHRRTSVNVYYSISKI